MAFPEETDRHKIDVLYTQWANTVLTIKMIKLQNCILNEKCDLEGPQELQNPQNRPGTHDHNRDLEEEQTTNKQEPNLTSHHSQIK